VRPEEDVGHKAVEEAVGERFPATEVLGDSEAGTEAEAERSLD
jgi:hypothetical protein